MQINLTKLKGWETINKLYQEICETENKRKRDKLIMEIIDSFWFDVLKRLHNKNIEKWELDEIKSYFHWDMLSAIESYNTNSQALFSTYLYGRVRHHPGIYFQMKNNSSWNKRKVLYDRFDHFDIE